MAGVQEKIKLERFVASVKSGPAQKTKGWYALRDDTVGGSEIATVLGLNPYKSAVQYIKDKLSAGRWSGNTATRWGNLFESITRAWTQHVLQMDGPIVETSSVEGVIKRQRYSPDGLGVVRLLSENNRPVYYIVLFEFKSPFGTLPNGKIPKHYVPQVQTGLVSIPICELALFINACYRKCTLSQLGFSSTYDESFHAGDFKKLKNGLKRFTPSACGLIYFYTGSSSHTNYMRSLGYAVDSDDGTDSYDPYGDVDLSYEELDCQILAADDVIDFGASGSRLMDRLLELTDAHMIQTDSSTIWYNSDVINSLEFIQAHELYSADEPVTAGQIRREITRFTQWCVDNRMHLIGYMPWKLFKNDILLEEPEPGWVEKIKEPCESILSTIDELKKASDPMEAFNAMFAIDNRTSAEEYADTVYHTADMSAE